VATTALALTSLWTTEREQERRRCKRRCGGVGEKSGRDKIEAVPDRIIVLENAGASAQAADEANSRIKQSAVVRRGRGFLSEPSGT
jgi:hypothetical protein